MTNSYFSLSLSLSLPGFPCLLRLCKPIGNGFPLGAVVTTPDIAQRFSNGME